MNKAKYPLNTDTCNRYMGIVQLLSGIGIIYSQVLYFNFFILNILNKKYINNVSNIPNNHKSNQHLVKLNKENGIFTHSKNHTKVILSKIQNTFLINLCFFSKRLFIVLTVFISVNILIIF